MKVLDTPFPAGGVNFPRLKEEMRAVWGSRLRDCNQHEAVGQAYVRTYFYDDLDPVTQGEVDGVVAAHDPVLQTAAQRNEDRVDEAGGIIGDRLALAGIQRGDGFLVIEQKIKAYIQQGAGADTGTATADIIRRLANVAAFALAGLLWLAIRNVIEE